MPATMLTKKVYNTQKDMDLPNNWHQELKAIIRRYNIDEQQLSDNKPPSKKQWSNHITDKVTEYMNTHIRQYKSTKTMHINKFKKQNYLVALNPTDAKKAIRYRLKMINLKAFYPGNYTNKLCDFCGDSTENIEHIFDCTKYPHSYISGENIESLLYSDDSANIKFATQKIHERIQYRNEMMDKTQSYEKL